MNSYVIFARSRHIINQYYVSSIKVRIYRQKKELNSYKTRRNNEIWISVRRKLHFSKHTLKWQGKIFAETTKNERARNLSKTHQILIYFCDETIFAIILFIYFFFRKPKYGLRHRGIDLIRRVLFVLFSVEGFAISFRGFSTVLDGLLAKQIDGGWTLTYIMHAVSGSVSRVSASPIGWCIDSTYYLFTFFKSAGAQKLIKQNIMPLNIVIFNSEIR